MTDWLDFERYAVFGLGKSGVAAANLLARRSKAVVASDTKSEEELAGITEELDERVEVVAGRNTLGDAQVVVVSPGLKPGLSIFDEVRARELPVISEIELAYAASEAPFLAITGTDGKSTVTTLLGHILREANYECTVGGNLGTPLCALVDDVSEDGYIVAEVSAFQLWSIHDFRPLAFGLTNIAYDHLDYFDTYDEYVEAKKRIMLNAGADTSGAFFVEDDHLRRFEADFEGTTLAYATSEEAASGYEDAFWIERGALSARVGGQEHRGFVADTAALPVEGTHNMLNALCATALAHAVGVELAEAGRALATFEPLPHRTEYVASIDGVRFYDDSKATNVHAAVTGLESLDGPHVAIVGGVDKGLDLTELVEFLHTERAPVVLIGAIRERLERELRRAGHRESHIHLVESLQEAVDLASKLARPGTTVSLSPACSSFDMFDSYAHRGEVYQKAVREKLDVGS